MRRLRKWVVAGLVLLFARKAPEERERRRRLVAEGAPDRGAENAVLVLFVLAGLFAVAFVVVYILEQVPRPTQVLGAALGLSLASLAAAMIVISKRLVVDEELEEEYSEPHDEEADEVAQILEESGSRFTRRRLLWTAGGAAGGLLGLALVTPAVSFGPAFDLTPFYSTPWRRGLRLVDEVGRAFVADEIEEGVFYTAFPEGADKDQLASPLIVVRLEPARLTLPPERDDWAPEGLLAFSKICTHAGCAISIYRHPKFEPVEPRPAFVCPCHYSTFDPATGGDVIFGPAGRPLPQLPLQIDDSGFLRAGGDFSAPVGPSWWGVRLKEPK